MYKHFAIDKLHQLAGYLSGQAQRIPGQKLARTLIGLFLIITLALTGKLFYLFRQRMHMEFPSVRAPVPKPMNGPSVDAIVLRRIRRFHHYLDSIQKNNPRQYDRLMEKRPHLKDSITMVEQLTHEQNDQP